jgi:hypothetical protein
MNAIPHWKLTTKISKCAKITKEEGIQETE